MWDKTQQSLEQSVSSTNHKQSWGSNSRVGITTSVRKDDFQSSKQKTKETFFFIWETHTQTNKQNLKQEDDSNTWTPSVPPLSPGATQLQGQNRRLMPRSGAVRRLDSPAEWIIIKPHKSVVLKHHASFFYTEGRSPRNTGMQSN